MNDINITTESLIRQFSQAMSQRGVKILLVHAETNHDTNQIETKLTSNSTIEGVQQIMAAIWRPTAEAQKILAHELEGSARATLELAGDTKDNADLEITVDYVKVALDKLVADGAFLRAAGLLFAQLQPHYTIAGWEKIEEAETPKIIVDDN